MPRGALFGSLAALLGSLVHPLVLLGALLVHFGVYWGALWDHLVLSGHVLVFLWCILEFSGFIIFLCCGGGAAPQQG